MFTGIVEETGEILAVEDDEGGRRLRIGTSFADLETGDSVSVNGVCLTVEAHGSRDSADGSGAGVAADRDRWFAVFLAAETRDRTYLDELDVGGAVNLERAMPADGRFDGHLVQGHVDGTAAVEAIESVGEDWRFTFSLPASLRQYAVEKGSLTVDGISLTVAALDSETVTVAIIPETYHQTTLASKSVGDPVHLEVDVLAKYVEGMLEARE